MTFCSAATVVLVQFGAVARPPAVTVGVFARTIVPIGALFAITLWLGNAAYVYLPVSFIQMLKAVTPLVVYAVGCVLGTESASWRMLVNLAVVVLGAVIAAAGEVRFMLLGVIVQVASTVSEATRLTLVQLLLQGTDIRLTPLSTM
ncbi:hypothetical protein MNEG_2682 [Monoraphidium neglectum]|uniref:Sugar phosphate transporter domain-containing protein n=1 Tax=Monoraphidium neglectum TaxID=145388 RepID=A0A0D2MY51_9CHLO|nr:hypothetical protein MNEG_2682 [Monoraphidium neglectum]KIZ05277.1 hypothetical protein MNEG_2682 [Monoraphidium neglectum]|eukprot:XP_013904296.1 hypothetical protein MNEG_2682 [Monoraphidium neglectum]